MDGKNFYFYTAGCVVGLLGVYLFPIDLNDTLVNCAKQHGVSECEWVAVPKGEKQ
jgi:hypothetical protein